MTIVDCCFDNLITLNKLKKNQMHFISQDLEIISSNIRKRARTISVKQRNLPENIVAQDVKRAFSGVFEHAIKINSTKKHS
jgi:hypothetical protein